MNNQIRYHFKYIFMVLMLITLLSSNEIICDGDVISGVLKDTQSGDMGNYDNIQGIGCNSKHSYIVTEKDNTEFLIRSNYKLEFEYSDSVIETDDILKLWDKTGEVFEEMTTDNHNIYIFGKYNNKHRLQVYGNDLSNKLDVSDFENKYYFAPNINGKEHISASDNVIAFRKGNGKDIAFIELDSSDSTKRFSLTGTVLGIDKTQDLERNRFYILHKDNNDIRITVITTDGENIGTELLSGLDSDIENKLQIATINNLEQHVITVINNDIQRYIFKLGYNVNDGSLQIETVNGPTQVDSTNVRDITIIGTGLAVIEGNDKESNVSLYDTSTMTQLIDSKNLDDYDLKNSISCESDPEMLLAHFDNKIQVFNLISSPDNSIDGEDRIIEESGDISMTISEGLYVLNNNNDKLLYFKDDPNDRVDSATKIREAEVDFSNHNNELGSKTDINKNLIYLAGSKNDETKLCVSTTGPEIISCKTYVGNYVDMTVHDGAILLLTDDGKAHFLRFDNYDINPIETYSVGSNDYSSGNLLGCTNSGNSFNDLIFYIVKQFSNDNTFNIYTYRIKGRYHVQRDGLSTIEFTTPNIKDSSFIEFSSRSLYILFDNPNNDYIEGYEINVYPTLLDNAGIGDTNTFSINISGSKINSIENNSNLYILSEISKTDSGGCSILTVCILTVYNDEDNNPQFYNIFEYDRSVTFKSFSLGRFNSVPSYIYLNR